MTTASSWKTVTVAPFIDLINGFAFPSDRFTEDEGMPLIRIRDLDCQKTEINFRGRYDNRYIVKRGDLLIGMDGDFLTVKWKGNNALLNQRVCKLVTKDAKRLTQDFLFYRIIDEIVRINRITSATTVKHLSSRDVLGIKIDLPPKPEQTKIAEILSTVDRAIEQTKGLIAKQQRIKTGLMQDLLTRGIDEHGNLRSEQTHQFKDSPLGRIPVEWDWKVLGSIIEVIDCKHYTPVYVEDGVPVIRPRNIKDSGFDLADLDYVMEKDYALLTDKHEPSDGDIVFSRNASFGVPVYVEGTGRFCIGQDVVVMRRKNVDTRFIYYALKSDPINRQIMNVSGGSTFGRIDLGAIRDLKVAFPKGNDEQREVAKRLSKCASASQMAELELAKLHSIKSALMQDLLTGKKRVTPLLDDTMATN